MKKIKNKRQFITIIILLLIILFIIILLSVNIGSANIKIKDTLIIITSKIPILKKLVNIDNINKSYQIIVTNIRLPRVLLAGLVGMGLSLCGTVYQGTLKNIMADSYILGVSAGASLGATIGIITGMGNVQVLAFIFAVSVMTLVYLISKKTLKQNSTFMILTGININYFITACISILMIMNRNQLEKIIFWTMGSFATSTWKNVIILAIIVLPLTIIISIFGKYFNAIALDEKIAKNVGINTELFKGIMLILTCLITALCVSTSGIIGFVGLMIPHIIRIIVGTNYKYLLPLSAIVGAIFLILSDTLARTIAEPTEIPIGIITSLIGAPFLIYLVKRK